MKYQPYESFRHGLITSKLWLCKHLEEYLPKDAKVAVLGSWTNILSFMLLTRNSDQYKLIDGYDLDDEATKVANEICDTWKFELPKVTNITQDINEINLENYNVVINTSVEHINKDDWFSNIKPNSLVCIQASDVNIQSSPWYINNPIVNLDHLKTKYKLQTELFADSKTINYGHWGYNRHMIIGIK